MKTLPKLLLAACVASAMLPLTAAAENGANQGYWVSSNGSVVKSGYGLCWRAGYWTPAMANAECDSDLMAKAEVPIPQLAAAIPVPAPMPAPEPARIMPRKISLSADALFDFDKSALKPEGKVLLDGLAKELNGVSYNTIAVTGYTDRIGSVAYNQKLSEQRANTVKVYLESTGIAANTISAEGKGKAQPVTNPGDCKGRVSKRVIACLQPDRRVDVEVSGAK
ncbi:MAG: OmpA family protein [Burkholderiales bacterium]